MNATVIFTPRALDEARESYAWHENRQPGLDERFHADLAATVDYLRHYPDTPRVVYRDFRRVMLKSFPYAVIYRLGRQTQLHIHTVFHCAQNLAKWKS